MVGMIGLGRLESNMNYWVRQIGIEYLVVQMVGLGRLELNIQ
jgi:hypothetical protein